MAGDGERRDWVPIVGVLAAIWLLVAIGLGFWLWREHAQVTSHDTTSCPVSGTDASSGDGRPRWQWTPPGRYCVLPVRAAAGDGVPRVWHRPGEWRSVLLIALGVTGLGLVGATAWFLRRDAREGRAPDLPVPDAPVDA